MKNKKAPKGFNIVLSVILSFIMFIASVAYFASKWYISIYGDTGFDSIWFTLTNGIAGAGQGIVNDYLIKGLLPAVLVSAALNFILFFVPKRKFAVNIKGKLISFYPFKKWLSSVLCLIISFALIFTASNTVGLSGYVSVSLSQSRVFDDEYKSPNDVYITFPAKKRNLIYIFLESMETTYLSKDVGGGVDDMLIPNLYDIANDNTNFSHNGDVGGFHQLSGCGWTVASMVAQTSGIPLKTTYIKGDTFDDGFFNGLVTLTDILKENGYYQTLMVGSDANFAHRDEYCKTHGIDKIYDLYTAREDKIIPDDYYVWWGYEDKHLYEYAKKELIKISQNGQPFAFTMLTVDTHHIEGYVCDYCRNEYDIQYENVISCADRQVKEFLDWLKAQDFYENTTVVITGDHLTMNNNYIAENVPKSYERHVYNCFVNSAVDTENTKNRSFAAVDMFPTTLAAMGCEIEGERLGIGTNLFSDRKTLLEREGTEYIDNEIYKGSHYYAEEFMN